MRLHAAWCSWVQPAQVLPLLSNKCMAAARRTTSSSLCPETQPSGASDAPMPQHYYEEPNPDRSAVHTDVIAVHPRTTSGANPKAQL